MSWKRSTVRLVIAVALFAILGGIVFAQFGGGNGFFGRRGRGGYRGYAPETGARNDWEIDERFQHDAFRFARVKYSEYGGGTKWATDFPESDLHLPQRLRELTSMEVHPESVIVELTDERLSDYPFIYIIEPGNMQLTDEEVAGLRRYLLNGGFLMVDDFWGEWEWDNFYQNIKRVFPDREPEELPLEHEIFHLVYDLEEKPMIVGLDTWRSGRRAERPDAQEPHYKGIFDDKGRMMAIICHNTDLGDGWEEEGVDPTYFKEYSERFAYPLGINIITYAMTH
ncbi:DUF4159 domain-containing protein [Blastopirellula sp. JC732]|uniref:DUF4159 domain-containing protein n=1 Tax=Blastopirellula sediminis TaxID=2894196 RepID=A0A9X1MHI1_9BACT|nr:DUF4159 domain-containing protein [Blastopirellula sediminis]MCC9608004.1 DUF4159 domain-containing protein [Blastopirellula sediminis]MCC9627203.1 DUF4159 domain-containing protein [Blastopirellula sediminis]